ncbi:hypothetical protein ACTA71_007437 [Dictyostelium dimigraforme]
MNKKEILSLLETKKTLIIVGGDQTEKAIQISQLLYGNTTNSKTIVCTEPKRSNAINLAELVSKQMNEQVGKTVGYGIRFEEKLSNETKIKFITDGLLVREMMADPLLNNYSTIIVDQVNERSISTDLLLALLKKLQCSTRPDLKLIILTSSNSNEINNFFNVGSCNSNNDVSIVSFGNEDCCSTVIQKSEIEKCKDLTSVVLQLKALNINNLNDLEMITSPSSELLNKSFNELFRLGAISSNKDDDSSKLTSIGNTMVGLPLEPIYSKVIIESEKLGCSEEILNIISMLHINRNNLFIGKLSSSSSSLVDNQSDHLTLLNVYNSFISNKCSSTWCNDNQINYQTIQTVQQIKNQLSNCLSKVSIKLLSLNNGNSTNSKQFSDQIKKSLLSGFFNNLAKSTTDNSYETTIEPIRKVLLHSTSFVTPESNQFILFGETIKIDEKEYIKDVSVIDQSWLH